MGIVALQLLFYYDNLGAKPLLPVSLQLLGFALPLLSSPVLYIYIRSLSFAEVLNWKNSSFYVAPYLIFIVIGFCLYASKANALVLQNGYPHFDATLQPALVYFLTALLAVVPGYYALKGLFTLLKYQKSLPDNYAYTEKINLNWLKWIVLSLLGLFVGLFVLIKYGVAYHWVQNHNLFAFVGAVLSTYVFFMGFCGLRQSTVLSAIPLHPLMEPKATTPTSYRNSGLTDKRSLELFEQLKLHMDVQKPFLQENLSLTLLAAQLNLTPNQLSQVINQQTQSNFFNFVNAYRVAAVKEKLKDPTLAHYSILGIAYECGFSSKSSFNKIFKEVTGQTPLQYQKSTHK